MIDQSPPVTRPAHLDLGYEAQQNGVSIRIVGGDSTPRTRAAGEVQWIIDWSYAKPVDRADFEIMYLAPDLKTLRTESFVMEGSSAALKILRNPALTIPFDHVIAIRVTLMRKGKVIAREEFKLP